MRGNVVKSLEEISDRKSDIDFYMFMKNTRSLRDREGPSLRNLDYINKNYSGGLYGILNYIVRIIVKDIITGKEKHRYMITNPSLNFEGFQLDKVFITNDWYPVYIIEYRFSKR